MGNNTSDQIMDSIEYGSNDLKFSLEELLHRSYNYIQWRKNCVELLESAFNKADINYIIYACRVTARFLFCRGAVSTAIILLQKVIELAPFDDKYNTNLIIADYKRFREYL